MAKNFVDTPEIKAWLLKNDPKIKPFLVENPELSLRYFEDLEWGWYVQHMKRVSDETGAPLPTI